MIIKYECYEGLIIVNVPDSSYWEIRIKQYAEDTGGDDYSLYLIFDDKKYLIRDTEYWWMGRDNLPCFAIGELYEEIVEIIAKQIADDPNLKIIDINVIESELIDSKYKERWLEKGYIELSSDGSW